jgi:hypothetical protein
MTDFSEDLINLLHPDKGFRLPIMESNIFFDRLDQIGDAGEGSPSNPFPGQFSEPSFDHVQPGRTRRREVEMETRVFGQPLFDDRVGMRSIFIQDQMKFMAAGNRPIDRLQELQELLMAVTRIAGSNNRAIQHVQGGEKTRRSMPFVVVRHRSTASLFHRQSRLSSIQGLDLRFFVDAQNQGFIRGIQIESDHIGQLFNEVLVLRQLERFDAMRLQSVGLPDTGHRGMADSNRLGHRPRTPMGCAGRVSLQGSINNHFHGRIVGAARTPTMRCIFADPGRAEFFKTRPPQKDRRTGNPETFGNGVMGLTVCGRQADTRSQDDSLRSRFRVDPSFQSSSLFRGYGQNRGWLPHGEIITQTSHHCKYITETLH